VKSSRWCNELSNRIDGRNLKNDFEPQRTEVTEKNPKEG
jgi:hypothetical protein